MRRIIGTSWKMNLTATQAAEYLATLVPLVAEVVDRDLFVLPAFPSIFVARELLTGTNVSWGAQDVHPADGGAHTGDVSAAMLADLGVRFVEVGHSERRRDHGETPELVAAKVAAVLRWGMSPVVCVGEARRRGPEAALSELLPDLERSLGAVAASEIGRVIVAYEPVWAIGEAATAAPPEDVAVVHRAIHRWLDDRAPAGAQVRVIYGGSVDPAIASELLGARGSTGCSSDAPPWTRRRSPRSPGRRSLRRRSIRRVVLGGRAAPLAQSLEHVSGMASPGIGGRMTRSGRLLGLLVAAIALAGCGGPSPSSSSSAAPSVAGPSVAGPSVAASAASRHGDPELEALLPDTLNGVTLTRESQRGVDLSQQSPALAAYLRSLGKTLEDFTLASAYSSSGDIKAQVGAWRIRGADSALLMPGFVEAVQADSTTKLTVTEASIAGHDVTQIGGPGQLTQGPLYAFVRGDTVLFVQTTDPAIAPEALSSMP